MLKLLASIVLGLAAVAAPAGAVVMLTQSQSFDFGEAFARAGADGITVDAAPVGSLFSATASRSQSGADGTASADATMLYSTVSQRLSLAASTSSRLEDAIARARATIIINVQNIGPDPFRLFLDIEIESIALQFDNLLSSTSNGQIFIQGIGSGGDGALIMRRDVITNSLFSVDCDVVAGLPRSASCSGGPQTLSFDLGLVLNPGFSTNKQLETQLGLEDPRFADNTSLFTGRLDGLRFSFRGVDLAPPLDVPEPATWTIVIVGFGLVGGAAWRRRSQQQYG